jgi:hypothetical protein
LQLRVGPFLAGIPVFVDLGAELAAGGDLLLGDGGLFGGEEPRVRLAPHRLSQAVVRAMAGLGITSAGATGLAAADCALGYRAATHGSWLSQITGDLTNTGWDIGRSGHG